MHKMDLIPTERVFPTPQTNATQGEIKWDVPKSIWLFSMMAGGLTALVFFFSWSAAVIMIALTALTICAGHSVGMHRLLIHQSFKTPKPVEYALVWLGTLVGMAGPFGMIQAHDMRDWHQRQKFCPPHPSHGAGFWQDAWWQMHCRFDLHHPPEFRIEAEVANDPFYIWLERYWQHQQLALALPLFMVGGFGLVLWGICLRISFSLIGHWIIGHYAHKSGFQNWHIEGLPVQGLNLKNLGLVTFGENWHGNHHAFPYSARLGLEPGQADPGFWFIKVLAFFGLATQVQLPGDQPAREGLQRVDLDQNASIECPTSAGIVGPQIKGSA